MAVDMARPIVNFKMRISPWWTDACVVFLNNFLKWYPNLVGKSLTALEFGSGNSTLFLLQKGFKTVSVESDDEFIALLSDVATRAGFRVHATNIFNFHAVRIEEFDLVLVKAINYDTTVKQSDCIEISNIIKLHSWSLIVNDGIARKQVLQELITSRSDAILLVDNVEYCANWGHLDTTSAKPELVKVYREILRSDIWHHYIFEQNEGREGRGVPDVSGWESPHRWASAILWPKRHLLNSLMVTNLGLPLVNTEGVNNEDLTSLETRCPFDWDGGKWVKGNHPVELDLGLYRAFD